MQGIGRISGDYEPGIDRWGPGEAELDEGVHPKFGRRFIWHRDKEESRESRSQRPAAKCEGLEG